MIKHYDIIIIGAGASGLFTAIKSPSYLSKLIIEKNKSAGTKILLSGGERANVSNIDIDPERDYFGQNKKALISLFKRYNNYDFISFLSENGIHTVEEDRGRIILESGNSRELLDFYLKKVKQNSTDLIYNSQVLEVNKNKKFEIKTINGDKYTSDNLVITTGGKSFSQVGTTGDGYELAQKFGHTIINPFRGLCALVSKKDLTEISGVSTVLSLEIISKLTNKTIYFEEGPLLFTHFGLSGPIIFNSSNAIGEYINTINITEFINNLDFTKIPINEKLDYITRQFIKDNIILKFIFNLENTPKRIVKFFDLNTENCEINLELQDCRTWKEAKVTGGGVKIDELTNNLESKIVPGLYFAGEILDITGKTGGFNLQFAWTSGHIVGKNLG
ncbi:aminoacetone oxidase family FAD-binding enzyme [Candidatus Gracilibacteria bacterium]|nr:aminoacetone oxidase family FAD-binding enzyme [Candidatus Gracilibacteria bacterium]